MAYQQLNTSDVKATNYQKGISSSAFEVTSAGENFTFLDDYQTLYIGERGNYIYVIKIAFTLPSAASSIKLQLLKGRYAGYGSVYVYHSTTNYTQNNMLGSNGLISKNEYNAHSLNFTNDGSIYVPDSSGLYYDPCNVYTLTKSFSAGTNYLYLYNFNLDIPLYGGSATNGSGVSSYLSYEPISGGGDDPGGDDPGSGGDSGGGGDSGSSISGNIKRNEKITAIDIANLKTAIVNIYANRNYLQEAGLKKITANSNGFGNTSISTNNYINQNFYYILKSILQLNSFTGIAQNDQFDTIFKNGVTSDLLTALTTASTKWETEDPKDKNHKPVSCRGGCVGFCYNACSGECTYDCYSGTDGGTSGAGGNNSMGTQTGTNCSNCDNECKGTCKDVCYKECKNGCGNSCGNGCTGCTSNCTGACKASVDQIPYEPQ